MSDKVEKTLGKHKLSEREMFQIRQKRVHFLNLKEKSTFEKYQKIVQEEISINESKDEVAEEYQRVVKKTKKIREKHDKIIEEKNKNIQERERIFNEKKQHQAWFYACLSKRNVFMSNECQKKNKLFEELKKKCSEQQRLLEELQKKYSELECANTLSGMNQNNFNVHDILTEMQASSSSVNINPTLPSIEPSSSKEFGDFEFTNQQE
jgi:hypothetical protein